MQGSADEVTDAMAKIFVWLRYSSSRQLTWQRNYNTQPRILGEAQARLTNAIAQVGSLLNFMHIKDKGHLFALQHAAMHPGRGPGPPNQCHCAGENCL